MGRRPFVCLEGRLLLVGSLVKSGKSALTPLPLRATRLAGASAPKHLDHLDASLALHCCNRMLVLRSFV